MAQPTAGPGYPVLFIEAIISAAGQGMGRIAFLLLALFGRDVIQSSPRRIRVSTRSANHREGRR